LMLATVPIACRFLPIFVPRLAGGRVPWLVPWLSRRLPGAARAAIALLLAGLLLCWRVHDALQARLPPDLEGLDLEVVGVVDGMPQRFEFGDRIQFSLASCRVVGEAAEGVSGASCAQVERLQLDWGPLPEKHRSPREDAGGEAGGEAAVWA